MSKPYSILTTGNKPNYTLDFFKKTMTYEISICHPDKGNIEKRSEACSSSEALEFFANYPWIEQLELMKSMSQEDVQYNPSVRFTHKTNQHSFEFTGEYKGDKLMFSLWYGRPVMKKVFFGLFGEKEVVRTIDKWSVDKETSQKHLSTFLEEKYDEVEQIMSK